jgi:hypothetical protein
MTNMQPQAMGSGDIDMSDLPDPNLNIPELQDIINAQQSEEVGPQMEGIAPPMEGAGPSMPTPEMNIAQKMAGGQPKETVENLEGKSINLITSSIRTLNQLADMLLGTDEMNSRAVRQMIRILGDILRNTQTGGTSPMGMS